MGVLAAIDATAKGPIAKDQVKWSIKGFQGGYSSPVIDGDRIYQVDNGSNLFAFDTLSGKELWKLNLGTIQKSSPVLGDGKLYVGTESGKFYILKPGPDRWRFWTRTCWGLRRRRRPLGVGRCFKRPNLRGLYRQYLLLRQKTKSLRLGLKSTRLQQRCARVAAGGSDRTRIETGGQGSLPLPPLRHQGRFLRENRPCRLDQLSGNVQPNGTSRSPRRKNLRLTDRQRWDPLRRSPVRVMVRYPGPRLRGAAG
jgi:hypothetical protein